MLNHTVIKIKPKVFPLFSFFPLDGIKQDLTGQSNMTIQQHPKDKQENMAKANNHFIIYQLSNYYMTNL